MSSSDESRGATPTGGTPATASASADEVKHEIEATRSDMTATLTAIEQRLNPADLKEKVVEGIHDVEAKVKVAVKEQFEEAKVKLKEEFIVAKDSVKTEIQETFRGAKQALRDATLGRVENMARRANDAAVETSSTIAETVRQNPIPAALVGVGLAWLFMNRSRSTTHSRDVSRRSRSARDDWEGDAWAYGGYDEYGRELRGPYRRGGQGEAGTFQRAQQAAGRAVDRVQETVGGLAHQASDAATGALHAAGGALSSASDAAMKARHDVADGAGRLAHQASDTVGHLAHQASEGVGSLAHQATDAVGNWAHQASDLAGDFAEGARTQAGRAATQARRLESKVEETYHTNPLAVGAALLAAGAVVGMTLPRTRREDVLMGETRDRLLHTAEGAAKQTFDGAHQLVESAAEKAKGALEAASKLGGRAPASGRGRRWAGPATMSAPPRPIRLSIPPAATPRARRRRQTIVCVASGQKVERRAETNE